MSEAANQPEVDLAANAQELLERYRQEEADLGGQMAQLIARREVVRDVIASLTAKKRAPRGRPPRQSWPVVAGTTGAEMGETIEAPETPEPLPPAA